MYPNGGSSEELHVPVHKPVKLIMASDDVLHSFFVPALRVKRDVVPGMFSSVWFEATHTGHDDIICAEYCGGQSQGPDGELPYQPSRRPAPPVPAGSGDGALGDALDALRRDRRGLRQVPEEHRRQVRSVRVDGPAVPRGHRGGAGPEASTRTRAASPATRRRAPPGVGPSWKGIWGKQESTNVGTVKVDDNYIRESILDPQAKIVTGFGPVMPTFRGQMTDQELAEVIAYIKSLK